MLPPIALEVSSYLLKILENMQRLDDDWVNGSNDDDASGTNASQRLSSMFLDTALSTETPTRPPLSQQ